jgi:hypothetical protein
MAVSPALKDFLCRLIVAERLPRPADEQWARLIERISVPGKIAEIDEETYFYFLEVLPPKFMGSGLFAFAEGAEPLRLFRKSDGQFYCRQLTWEETETFCNLAHMSFPYWF